MSRSHRSLLIGIVTTLLLSATGWSAVRLPGFFGDHMVLQRDVKLPVWGWADPGEEVTVTLAGKSAATKADGNGEWRVELPAMTAGGPFELSAKGGSLVTFSDILIGEVWLCSGQSNMEWVVRNCTDAAADMAAANLPQIRHIKIPLKPSATPLNDIAAPWQVCTPETVGNFTACGYFMARDLLKELKVPIGLINSSWGGTRIEPWTPPVGFASVPELKSINDQIIARSPGNPSYKGTVTTHIGEVEKWVSAAKQAVASGAPVAPSPAFPASLTPPTSHQEPLMLYNAMIHAMVGFPIRGAIWYQGESNHNEGMLYAAKMKALIEGWRKIWGIGEFPFYYVQIAPFQYGTEAGEIVPQFWEAQSAVLDSVSKTGMVVTSDIATINNIHPPNKQEVGRRLALLALHRDYGRNEVVDSGPTPAGVTPDGANLRVRFNNAAGLKSRDGKPLTHFEVAGIGTGFQPAVATIDGDSVVLNSAKVPQPLAMRFAWDKNAEPNLQNGVGLPASAFRAGEIPKPDFLPEIKDAAAYTLVYDLNLENLARTVRYDIDKHAELKGKFDRIGYLIELAGADGQTNYLYTSMDAFTDNLAKIAIPTFDSGAVFQTRVRNLTVQSNVAGIVGGSNLDGGNIEFWACNYGPINSANIPGASSEIWDFGDQPAGAEEGYGCMQVHNFQAKQTLFAINQWRGGAATADIGIGNSNTDKRTRDWTFSGNGGTYTSKRLRVFVRMK